MLTAFKNKAEIGMLKLNAELETKDLREANKIFDMIIYRDKKFVLLLLTQKDYIQNVFAWFSMESAKAIDIPMPLNIQLSWTKPTWRGFHMQVQLVV